MTGKSGKIFLTLLFFISVQVQAATFKSLEQELGDSFITAKIIAQFTETRVLNPFKISVSTENGIVYLSGFVDDKKAYIEALRLASNTKGVKDIDCEDLVIKKVNTSLTDALITTKVEASVLKAKVLDDESIPLVGINAHTVNGTVTLSGKVGSREAAAAVIKQASKVRGVKKIISMLQISEDTSV